MYNIYLYPNSNMQVSFNKITYMILVYFESCYLSLSMSLKFLNIYMNIVYECTKNSVLESLHFYGKHKI